jgi:peptidoglycan/LPS O-acetylase OafA/YrhL
VSIFFVISGYLVMRSWAGDPAPHRYAARRALRIYPGLIVLVLTSMLVLGPLAGGFPLRQYVAELGFLGYLNALLLFPMPFELPGVFGDNPYPRAVNGSLWTLSYGATMYLLLALFARPKLGDNAIYWVQQTLAHFGLARNVYLNLFLVTAITLVLAVLSWVFVEKPALLLKPSRPLSGSAQRY